LDIPSDKDAVRLYVLSEVEEEIYFAAARKWPNLRDLGRLMLNQGCRPEEILSLERSAIDLERGLMTIQRGKSRAARRHLYLTGQSRELLTARLSGGTVSRWVFPSSKLAGMRIAKLNGAYERALELTRICKSCGKRRLEHKEKLGCKFEKGDQRLDFVLYDFRHTFATRAAEGGMPIAILASILGHRDLRSVMKYIHVRQEAQDKAMVEHEQKMVASSLAHQAVKDVMQ
jgi:integrase